MTASLQHIIRNNSTPLQPVTTDCTPQLQKLSGIKSILFDMYGTLFISASGEVGTHHIDSHDSAMYQALDASGIQMPQPQTNLHQILVGAIKEDHSQARSAGIDYPEVDICKIWNKVLCQLTPEANISQQQLFQLAVEYEVRTNPVWPMPDCLHVLQNIQATGLRLGIISNAQFYTPLLIPSLLNSSVEGLGFQKDLQFYSYQYGHAKPGLTLFNLAVDSLARQGIAPDETVYLGNDMLNDILPAATVGFRTALFAGDSRSLRLRKDDERVSGISPDLVITQLNQLPACLF